jgi:hypothetical protein
MPALRRALAGVSIPEIVVIVLAVATLVALSLLEKTQAPEPNIDSYSSYDAASGGYRAFYELLDREGISVERFEQRPAFLDPSVDTLVYAEPLSFDPRTGESTQADAYDIEAWVRHGGRLLYLGYDNAAAKQKILALPFARLAGLPIARTPGRPGTAYIAPALRNAGVANIGVLAAGMRWKATKNVLVNDGRGPAIVSYPFGTGVVTAVIDQTLFDNTNLTFGDRARSRRRATRAASFRSMRRSTVTRLRNTGGRSFHGRSSSRSPSRRSRCCWPWVER